MKVTLAAACGFCYGVRRAVELAGQAEKGTHTLGPIIHNPQVVGRLAAHGVSPVDSLDDVDKGAVILIRSHGVGPDVYEQADQKELKVIDATCPHVKKAQQDAKNIVEKGEKLIIVGEKSHPEVISISQWGANRAIIIDRKKKLKNSLCDSMGVVVQTTFSQEQFKRIAAILQRKTNHLDVHMTICTATQQRQQAAIELAGHVDAMIVVAARTAPTQAASRRYAVNRIARHTTSKQQPNWIRPGSVV